MIRVYSTDGTLVGVIDHYETLTWTRRWRRPGEFSLTISRIERYAEEVTRNRVVVIDGDPAKAGLVRYRQKTRGEQEEGLWVIRGVSLQGVLSQRRVLGAQPYDGAAETIMKAFVDAQAVSPTDADREIPHLEIAADQERGSTTRWPPEAYQNVSEVLARIASAEDLGWDVRLQFEPSWAWVFDVHEGVNRAVGNPDTNPPVIFSIDFDNVAKQEYIEDGLTHRSVAIVGGQGQGGERTLVQVGTDTGLERHETFVDARDTDEVDALAARGTQRLAQHDVLQTVQAEVLPYATFRYGEDYDLGDRVTLQVEGFTVHRRILTAKETRRPGQPPRVELGFGVEPADMTTVFRDLAEDPAVEHGEAEGMDTHGNEYHDPDFATETDLTAHEDDDGNPHGVTSGQVGLGNVLNEEQEVASNRGIADGYAPLDGDSLVPEIHLPDVGFFDEVTLDDIVDEAKTTPGGTEAERLAVTDSDGRVGDSLALGGMSASDALLWRLLDSHEDDNQNSVFDRDSGALALYDLYLVMVSLRSENESNQNQIRMQINGLTASNYDTDWISSSVGGSTGNAQWMLTDLRASTGEQTATAIKAFLRGRTPPGSYRVFPSMSCQLAGSRTSSNYQAFRGTYTDDVGDVNRVRVFSTLNATGKMQVFGRDLT